MYWLNKMAALAKPKVDIFHDAIDNALEKQGKKGLDLKEAQYEALKGIVVSNRDTLCVLPTGYGKSLIYQLLPDIFDFYLGGEASDEKSASVIVVSPLNALMQDQISKLKGKLDVRCVKTQCEMESATEIMKVISLKPGVKQPWQILFAHPEALIGNKQVFTELRAKTYQDSVKAVVVDEAHLVVEWKKFRPCYGKLGLLASVFPKVPHLALTATATVQTKNDIVVALGLLNPLIIEINPDRPNIFFASYSRPSKGDDKLEGILKPLVDELENKRHNFPLTLIYANLQIISECFMYFSQNLGPLQYDPKGAAPLAKNRMFTQFHAQYPEHYRERIVQELVEGTSKLKVLFVTIAFGIGVDVNNIRRIIHIGVPYTMEEYFQEAGRCGRDGLPATATIFYNSYDISAAKKNMSHVMREFVKCNKCKREMILSYFGHKLPKQSGPDHLCCDFHQQHCPCEECVLVSAAQMFELHESENIQSSLTSEASDTTESVEISLAIEEREKLRKDLLQYRMLLHGCGRTCVGSTSLASGFSLELIDMAVNQAKQLTSVEEVKSKLPVFVDEHAMAIFKILQRY